MSRSLKEQYEMRKVNSLQQRLPLAEKKLVELQRDPRDLLILEAFDKQQMAAAVDIMKKLKATDFAGLDQLNKAKGAALNDVAKVMGGGGKDVIRTIVNLFKKKGNKAEDNPLITALAFVEGVRNFFDGFIQYVEALPDVSDEKTLSHVITGQEDADALQAAGADKNVKKKLGDLQKVIINGLKPNDALSKMGRNWVNEYLGGGAGMKALAGQIIKSDIKSLKQVGATVAANFKNVEAVGQAAVGASEQGSVGSSGTTSTDKTAASAPGGSPSEPAKSGTAEKAAPGAQVPGSTGAGASAAGKTKFGNLLRIVRDNPKSSVKLLDALIKAGLKPESLPDEL